MHKIIITYSVAFTSTVSSLKYWLEGLLLVNLILRLCIWFSLSKASELFLEEEVKFLFYHLILDFELVHIQMFIHFFIPYLYYISGSLSLLFLFAYCSKRFEILFSKWVMESIFTFWKLFISHLIRLWRIILMCWVIFGHVFHTLLMRIALELMTLNYES